MSIRHARPGRENTIVTGAAGGIGAAAHGARLVLAVDGGMTAGLTVPYDHHANELP